MIEFRWLRECNEYGQWYDPELQFRWSADAEWQTVPTEEIYTHRDKKETDDE